MLFVVCLHVDYLLLLLRKCVCVFGLLLAVFLVHVEDSGCAFVNECVSPCVFLHPLVSYALLVFVASCGDQVRFHGCSKPIAPGDDTLERGNLQRPGVGQRVNKRLSWGPSK